MSRKLILPAESKVCATCSFWDGERRVDEEVGVVVIDDGVEGVCLVHDEELPATMLSRVDPTCAWEPLEADAIPALPEDENAEQAAAKPTDSAPPSK